MTASLSVNGKNAGLRIAKPYEFDVSGLLSKGENKIEIIVANSHAGKVRDHFTTFLQVPPTGLMGPVELISDKE